MELCYCGFAVLNNYGLGLLCFIFGIACFSDGIFTGCKTFKKDFTVFIGKCGGIESFTFNIKFNEAYVVIFCGFDDFDITCCSRGKGKIEITGKGFVYFLSIGNYVLITAASIAVGPYKEIISACFFFSNYKDFRNIGVSGIESDFISADFTFKVGGIGFESAFTNNTIGISKSDFISGTVPYKFMGRCSDLIITHKAREKSVMLNCVFDGFICFPDIIIKRVSGGDVIHYAVKTFSGCIYVAERKSSFTNNYFPYEHLGCDKFCHVLSMGCVGGVPTGIAVTSPAILKKSSENSFDTVRSKSRVLTARIVCPIGRIGCLRKNITGSYAMPGFNTINDLSAVGVLAIYEITFGCDGSPPAEKVGILKAPISFICVCCSGKCDNCHGHLGGCESLYSAGENHHQRKKKCYCSFCVSHIFASFCAIKKDPHFLHVSLIFLFCLLSFVYD